jgi:hypothetical protein
MTGQKSVVVDRDEITARMSSSSRAAGVHQCVPTIADTATDAASSAHGRLPVLIAHRVDAKRRRNVSRTCVLVYEWPVRGKMCCGSGLDLCDVCVYCLPTSRIAFPIPTAH